MGDSSEESNSVAHGRWHLAGSGAPPLNLPHPTCGYFKKEHQCSTHGRHRVSVVEVVGKVAVELPRCQTTSLLFGVTDLR